MPWRAPPAPMTCWLARASVRRWARRSRAADWCWPPRRGSGTTITAGLTCARRLADPAAMTALYTHLEVVLEQIDFRDRTQAGTNLMNRIRRFLQRAELDANEVNILRGLLTSVQQRRRRAGEAVSGP